MIWSPKRLAQVYCFFGFTFGAHKIAHKRNMDKIHFHCD